MGVPQLSNPGEATPSGSFERFSAEASVKLRRVFASRYGVDVADDLTSEVIEHAWANWDQLRTMTNPIGFLYRVGCSKARRYHRWGRSIHFPVEPVRPPESKVDIFLALRRLTRDQRVAVLAVHGFGWSYAEVAEILDTTEANVTNHVHRGLTKLRIHLS